MKWKTKTFSVCVMNWWKLYPQGILNSWMARRIRSLAVKALSPLLYISTIQGRQPESRRCSHRMNFRTLRNNSFSLYYSILSFSKLLIEIMLSQTLLHYYLKSDDRLDFSSMAWMNGSLNTAFYRDFVSSARFPNRS